jgi:hypothetical protein
MSYLLLNVILKVGQSITNGPTSNLDELNACSGPAVAFKECLADAEKFGGLCGGKKCFGHCVSPTELVAVGDTLTLTEEGKYSRLVQTGSFWF